MKIYEDLLDQIELTDVAQRNTRHVVNDADDEVYDINELSPQTYDYKIAFDLDWPGDQRTPLMRYCTGNNKQCDAKSIFNGICEQMDEFLDSMRAIRSHSPALIATWYKERFEECGPRVVYVEDKEHTLNLVVAFSASFTNVRRLITFIAGVYTICNWEGKNVQKQTLDYVLRLRLWDARNNGWRSLHTITGTVMDILPTVLKTGSKNLTDKQRRYFLRDVYSFCEYLYNGDKMQLVRQFITVTGDDQSSQLFSRAVQFIDSGVEGNKLIKNVKLNARMRDMLMSAVYDETTIRKIAHQSYYQSTTFPTPQSPNRNSLDAIVMRECKFYREQLAAEPRSAVKIAFKTLHGGTEFVFCAYLGLFDTQDIHGRGAEPCQLIIFFGGDVYYEEAYKKFQNLLGDKFDEDLFYEMFENMVANSR